MFNISKKTEIVGLEKIKCTRSQLQYYLHKCSDKVKYSLFSTRRSAGTIDIHTSKGDFTIQFKERDGWANYIKVL